MNTEFFVGNLTADPELRVGAQSGKRRLNFTLAINEGDRDSDTERTHFLDFVAWEELAENIANSMRKGQRMVVVARVETFKQEWFKNDGQSVNLNRVSFKVVAAGPDLRWAQAKIAKVYRDNSNDEGSQPEQQQANQPAEQPQPQQQAKKAPARQSQSRQNAAPQQQVPDEADDF